MTSTYGLLFLCTCTLLSSPCGFDNERLLNPIGDDHKLPDALADARVER